MADQSSPNCSCAALRKASRHVTRLYDDALAPHGLGLNQYSILSTLHRAGPVSIQDLAGLLVTDRSTVGHLLRPLEARQLVEVAVAEDDRRARRVTLTESGLALLTEARPAWAKAQRRFEETFGEGKLRDLHQLLDQAATAEFGRV